MGSHAVLSPSSASRWLACTPSARLEAELPQNESVYADEGTLAHSLAELIIKRRLGRILQKVYKAELKKIESHELYTGEMYDYCDGFATYVMELYNGYQEAHIFTEDAVDLTRWVPDGFGTVDIRIVVNQLLIVADFKYGKGVPVFADNNSQLKLYALGALEEMRHLFNIQGVKLIIYQPRIENVSTFELSAEDLENWGDVVLRPLAQQAHEGKGDFVPGAHCQFCKIKPTCKALASYNLDLARERFKDETPDPALLTPEEIAEILKREKFFTDWLTAVSEYALAQSVNHGVSWPGMKLVEGISRRGITDEAAAAADLVKAGCKPGDIYKPMALRGITDLTKMLGKTDFEKLVGPYIVKPPGKPVLVPDTDKRPAFSSADRARDAFKND